MQPNETIIDHDFDITESEPVTRNGKMYINPFGVLLSDNISGQERAESVHKDAAFLNSIRVTGILQPVNVEPSEVGGKPVWRVSAGNRRTAALRLLISKGDIPQDDARSWLPIYPQNAASIGGVSDGVAVNLIENSMRKRMDHISKARAIQALIDQGTPKDKIALMVTGSNGKPLGKSQIYNLLKLLKLDPQVQRAVSDGWVHINHAVIMSDMSPEEQLADLQTIMDAQPGQRSKVAEETVKKRKKERRTDREGNPIHGDPLGAREMVQFFRDASKSETWDCIPKGAKLGPVAYTALTEIFSDLETWAQGGLQPKTIKPNEENLTLKLRILQNMQTLQNVLR
jgi:ParB-like chromosome segregation protein Spo0J